MYCIYLRKSRADADLERLGEDETLARHRRALTELAERSGYAIGEVYEEIVSGETLAARPQMQRLLSDVEGGKWQGVLVMELERLARGNSIDQGIVMQTFTATGTLIITPSKVYNPREELDEEYLEFGLFMSRREYKTINRRLKAGMYASVKEGNWIHHSTPFGYDRQHLEKGKGWKLVPNPQEAPFVKMMFEWYVNEGLTPGKIAERFDSLGVKSRSGAAYFSVATVRDMLKNEAYIGAVVWHKRPHEKIVKNGQTSYFYTRNAADKATYEGKHEPLISRELFEAAQIRIGKNPRVRVGTDLVNPFAGLVFCRECGRAMIYRRYRGNIADALICPNKYCSVSMIGYHIFEPFVLEQIAEAVGALKLQAEHSVNPLINEQITALSAQLSKLRKQENSLYDLLEQGVYTPQVFAERKAAVSDKITAAETELSQLREKAEQPEAVEQVVKSFDDLISRYSELTNRERNALLSRCVERITYYRAPSRRYAPQPFEVRVELKV